jgi:AbrB family looped-hinge helix DNA binding protein
MQESITKSPTETVEDARITRKGQVTLPAAIRRQLNLKRGDRVTFLMKGNDVRLSPGSSPVERTKGVVREHESPLSAEQLRATTERPIAQDVIRRSGGA